MSKKAAVTTESETVEPQAISGLIAGRGVFYVLPDGPCAGEYRPGVIIKVKDHGTGESNLQVFMDGLNDSEDHNQAIGVVWKPAILFSETGGPNTWHFIELV